ncbi:MULTISPECIES: IclR family transcriptional regulator [Achromobacter]|uniref:Transcriptional repressor IclR n=2 Tax=Achromobacter piechaudii TaxID=72556 RepID=A0A6S7EAL1_9BURK|nr:MULTISPECIES: IclR family transcriptional regulator [Achromobacter]EFF76872.1 IclR helix-turn-helix domain protein [Achromobacter piechaudii ATCC 43553]KNY12432.1 transcriptional regulator [Achromobacter piechaudii]MPS78784.1 IclR family transcriptional regulator [Achromobacter sp.]CAB3714651.1 Transcriptional repressor IclR [Achromobacter piechaudii]CAB3881370.1 Transcriptional repressor IclR [Achromobacter piechaudii]
MARPGKVEKDTEKTPTAARRGIQSIEVGFRILDLIRKTGRPLPLKEIADACELTVPNVHYYLVSFQKVGVVQQHADTGHYGLGPYALRLGLAALEQFDVFTSARPIMAEVAAVTGHTVFLGVWGNKGPTIVYRVEGSRSRPLLELRVGTVMPLLSSALGRNFLAHLPDALTRDLLERELASSVPESQGGAPGNSYTAKDVQAIRDEVQKHHISRCRHALLPHFTSLSAPIFDMLGEMTAAITLMGPVGAIDDDLDSSTARLLREKARSISAMAGWEDGEPDPASRAN